MAKLTLEDAREMRRLAAKRPNPPSRSDLATRYAISVTLVGRVLRGEAYPDPDKRESKRQELIDYIGAEIEPEDYELVEEYAQIHALQQEMIAALETQAMTVKYTNKAGATNDTKHPLLGEIKAYSARKTAILAALGLTRKQRLGLGSGASDEGDGWDDL